MSINGQQIINIGLPNESIGSDSLYTAFSKTKENFTTLFTCASPYTNFVALTGISVNSNANTGTVSITNTGVTNIIAGTNITISQANGNVTISSTGGGNGGGSGTVTSVGLAPVSTGRIVVTNSPIVSSGNIGIDLAVIANITPATYTNPNVTVDVYGRVTAVSNGSSAGTVTSIGLTPGAGIQINGGPITSNGNITVTNIGVTRVSAGTGIAVSSSNGNVTISSTSPGGTVTAVGLSSSQLVVSGSPVVSSGTIAVNLPDSVTFSGSVTANSLNLPNNITVTSTAGNTTGINSSYLLSNVPLFDSSYGNATRTNLEFLKVNAPALNTAAKIGDVVADSSNVAVATTILGAIIDFGASWGVPVSKTWFEALTGGDNFNISGPTIWNFSGNGVTTFPIAGNVNLGNAAIANYFTSNIANANYFTSNIANANSFTSNIANIKGTTASTSKSTGALTVAGGVGVVGDIYAGNSIAANGGAYGEVVITQFASVFGSGSGPNPRSIMQVRGADLTAGIGMQAISGANGQIYANTGIIFTTGSTIRDKDFPTGGTTRATLDSTGLSVTGNVSASGIVNSGVYTTSTLPTAATAGAGARAFVTDATSTTFKAAYVGGAANAVPIFSDGTSWYIG